MEPNAFFARPSLSGDSGGFGSGMSPMNLSTITQISREAWRETERGCFSYITRFQFITGLTNQFVLFVLESKERLFERPAEVGVGGLTLEVSCCKLWETVLSEVFFSIWYRNGSQSCRNGGMEISTLYR